MPASRLGLQALVIQECDVLGIDARSSPQLIQHVGLADQGNHALGAGVPFTMIHMGPPLVTEALPDAITSIGTAALTSDEVLQIRLFIDNIEGEYQAARVREALGQYCVAPHVRPRVGQDGTVICQQFSCGGFVLEAYKFAGLTLLETKTDVLPLVELETLITQYPEVAQLLENERFRDRMGIPGNGPWPVVLAGYILNALNRPESEIRVEAYRARAGDEFFPTRDVVSD